MLKRWKSWIKKVIKGCISLSFYPRKSPSVWLTLWPSLMTKSHDSNHIRPRWDPCPSASQNRQIERKDLQTEVVDNRDEGLRAVIDQTIDSPDSATECDDDVILMDLSSLWRCRIKPSLRWKLVKRRCQFGWLKHKASVIEETEPASSVSLRGPDAH